MKLKESMLSIQNLRKSFGEIRVLNGVSLDLPEATMNLLIGPNGSGKTTLVNIICGFLKPDEGRILFKGEDITGKPPHEIYNMGVVRTFQISQPLKKLSVLENIMIARRNKGEGISKSLGNSWVREEREVMEKAFNILKFLELDHLWHHEAEKLSGGQLKLLEVGRALMADAKLIIMDEPIASVAPALSHKILKKLKELTRLGITLLVVEHRLETILEYADTVYAMVGGKIIARGAKEEVISNQEVIEAYLGEVA